MLTFSSWFVCYLSAVSKTSVISLHFLMPMGLWRQGARAYKHTAVSATTIGVITFSAPEREEGGLVS